MASYVDRIIGAATLDVAIYEEVEADEGATTQALGVVVLSSLAAGIGGASRGATALVALSVAALIAWAIWAVLTFVIGAKLMPESQTRATLGQLLRTIGFASSPGILRVVGLVPVLGGFFNLVIGVWMLAAMVVAVRQALDYESTARAAIVCLIGWVVYVGALLAVALMFGAGTIATGVTLE